MTNVTIIDYGLGNLYSVQRGLEQCGVGVTISADPKVIVGASRLILPGVGAFSNAMQELQRIGLVDAICEFAVSGRPLLGICLGMQLLLDESEEFGVNRGLGIIPGRVVPVPATTTTGEPQKIPHIGWNELVSTPGSALWTDSILSKVNAGDAVYFVHSFMAQLEQPVDCLADCVYGGHRVTSVIRRGNVLGCQFHPEKSGEVGLAILKEFCTVKT